MFGHISFKIFFLAIFLVSFLDSNYTETAYYCPTGHCGSGDFSVMSLWLNFYHFYCHAFMFINLIKSTLMLSQSSEIFSDTIIFGFINSICLFFSYPYFSCYCLYFPLHLWKYLWFIICKNHCLEYLLVPLPFSFLGHFLPTDLQLFHMASNFNQTPDIRNVNWSVRIVLPSFPDVDACVDIMCLFDPGHCTACRAADPSED